MKSKKNKNLDTIAIGKAIDATLMGIKPEIAIKVNLLNRDEVIVLKEVMKELTQGDTNE